MQILGDLIKLPKDNDLPLPWWHRAPLGLQSGTCCYLAIVKSDYRPVADLVISVLNPANWDNMFRVKCYHSDMPGVASKAVEIVQGYNEFNIALAETVTLEAGGIHETTLVCEPFSSNQCFFVNDDFFLELKDKLEKDEFKNITFSRYNRLPASWIRRVEVNNGWVRDSGWRTEFRKTYGRVDDLNIDLSKAIVSADTTFRLLRYVFPFNGAKTIKIEHRDEPSSLQLILDSLKKSKLNVLSNLLRRGGAMPGNAVLVSTCEPSNGQSIQDIYDGLQTKIKSLPAGIMAHMQMNDGVDAKKTTVLKNSDSIIATVPDDLIQKYRDLKKQKDLPEKLSIFFSHRFSTESRSNTIEELVRRSVTDNMCQLFEASPDEDVRGQNLVFTEVSAKMWASNAAIILVTQRDDIDPIGQNIPHEFGFFQGQAKPILLLIESGLEGLGWSNIDGVFAPRLPKDELELINIDHQRSVYRIIDRWIDKVFKIPTS